MSVIFSKFSTPGTVYSQNGGAITTSTESIDAPAGYFRIGFVVLQIPPEDIICQRVVNNDKEAVLRAQNEMFIKSGQARWDVTIRWKALQDDGAADIYQQWEDLQNIIAIFRAAPFVEVESPHLRQIFASKSPDMAGIKLAMALRQLRIDTDPDIVDCLNVTLSMTFFNYFPYTADFGYQDEVGNSVAAYQSALFRDYINKWKTRNLSCQPRQPGDPGVKDWKSQDPGVVKVTWREYTTVFDGKQPGFSDTTISNGSPSTPTAPSFGQLSSNGSYDSLFNKYAPVFGLDPVLVKAVCRDESNFNPTAVNPNAKGVTAASCLQHFNSDPDGGTAFCNGRKHTAIGLMQLDWPTARTLAQKMGLSNFSPKQLLDPETNIRIGCKCMQSMKITGLSNVWQYQGKYMSAAAVAAYQQKNGVTLLSSDAYVANITKYYNQYSQGQPTQQQITVAQKANADALAAAKQAAQNQSSTPSAANTADATFYATLQNMTSQGWILDHRVDTCSFYYKEHDITLAPNPLLAKYNTDEDLQSGLYPQQFTILLVNNLAQIPLASYQYPTYQHVGPCSSMISVSFLSVGDTSLNSEPQHNDLAELTTMSHTLEEQYLKMRTLFRRTSAIYRTQAVFVENQVLNMCGIHGLMLDQITNETIRDSSNMLSVQMTAGQYENVFEDIGPFRISGISQAYQSTFNNIIMGSSSQLDSISNPAEKNLLPNTLAFRQGYQNSDLGYIVSALKATCNSSATGAPTNDILGQMAGSLSTVSMSAADKAALCSIADSSSNNATAQPLMVDTYTPPPPTDGYLNGNYPAIQTRVKSLEAGAQPTIADVTVLLSFVPNGDSQLGGLKTRLTAQMALNADSIKSIYTAAAPQLYSSNLGFAKEARTMEGSPMFSQQFASAVPAGGPSTDPANQNHGSYRDMGLSPMYFNGQDFNPGMYFTDWSKVYNTLARKNLMDTLQLSQQAQNQLAGTNTLPSSTGAVIESANKPKLTLSDSTNPISGDINSVMRQTNLAGYTMAEAFPTFKLFLMEENNQNLFYAFDNFYSYAAVQDIEIIWNYKKPATMILRMTNLAHLLNVKLFDDTTAGKREQWYQRFTAPAVASPTSGGGTITGQTGFSTTAGKTMSNQPYMVVDMREGHPGDEGQPNKRVPLKYFPLQTGTKIQLRVGSKNDPDQLDVVFGGVVTEVEGNDVITITAQSFLHEMMSVPSDKANCDSWLHFGNAVKSCFTWLPGIHLSRGPAYGGYTIFGQSGDAGTILKSMLKASDAKHFGHWQLNMSQDKLLKGYTWSEVLAAASDAVGAAPVASILRSAGDRCGENVLINDVINYDGTRTGIEGRTYMDQQGGSLLAYLRKFKYYIAPDCSLSLWELLQDVGRRYPEYLLLEKPYGFPYSNEATIVFGHPLDWYYARPELLGDSEAMRAKDPDGNKFKTWWDATGKNQVMRAINAFKNMGTIGPSYQYDSSIVASMGNDEQSFEQGLIQLCYGKMETFAAVDPETGQQMTLPTLGMVAGQASNWIGFLGEKIFNSATDRNLRDQFNEVYRSYAATILGPNLSPSDRLQPIRQYHFIDHQSIVHNALEINGRVYNTVKIGNEDPVYANQNIPAQHRRLLDVTHLINDPQKNVIDQGLVMQCAQSFLREELGKMYRGEIILRGNPKIRPMDILILTDPSTGMTGPLEVEQVIHSLNLENGFVTIVKPRACITVNEAASPVFWSALTRSASVAGAMIAGFAVNHTPAFIATSAAAVGLSSLVGMFGAPLVSSILTGLGTTLMTVTAATTGALTATAGTAAASTVVGAAVTAGVANAAATGVATAGGWLAGGVGVLASAPIVPIVAIVGVCVVAAVIGVLYFTDTNTKLNPLVVSPVLRFGRPWVGGIEGYAINDMLGTAQEKIHQFMDEEIYPTMDLWNQMSSLRNNIDIQQPGPALANPNPAS